MGHKPIETAVISQGPDERRFCGGICATDGGAGDAKWHFGLSPEVGSGHWRQSPKALGLLDPDNCFSQS